VLAAGNSYPNIILTVNVASNAPASLTNTATISGGNDQSTNDNTASDPTTVTAIPSSAQLVDDPCFAGMNALLVSGTGGDDTITLRSASRGKITVIINSANLGTFKPTGLIIVLGQAGNDTITIDDAITQPRMLYGNAGNDTIKDGVGLGIIIGGAGDDTLSSKASRNILIGGSGADRLTGSLFGDILIAGSTSYDEPTTNNQAALCSIYAEWSNLPRSYQSRINHLTGASSGGLNGTNWLKPGQTVFDDSSKDTLIGGPGQDWFLLNTTGAGILDTSDRNRWEIATDL
jgi:Ca2+-binding RTX toxin-like protein